MVEQTSDVAMRRQRLAAGLLDYGASFTELGRRFAETLGVHSTDAFALMEIAAAEQAAEPLSPALLSKRVTLTSGAMTTLLNRLEQAGYITRSREHTDRRVVTLRCSEHARRLAEEFFHSVNTEQDAILAEYEPAQLAEFERLLGRLRGAMDREGAP
ncbi:MULTISPECIES: MarR family transcriptional regulator [Nocardia]|uniref:MarR family winged helix-turn-helix transcriptional regulator n=1 Tax=Nocardia TaxID=1817 RepID=UPI0015EE7CE2|nr:MULTISPECIES: MarR family transcriptional regulator [Nocardia]MCA2207250.1 MarR family transcriptional regulator [Nocardia rosealba]